MSGGFDSIDPVDDYAVRGQGSASLPRSYSSYLASSAEEAFDGNYVSLGIQWARREWDMRQALLDNPLMKPLDVETANAKYGIEGSLKFDAPIYEMRARDMRNRRASQMRNQEVFANPDVGTLGWLGGTAVAFAVGATDPLNIASAFIPYVGEARAAKWLGAAYTSYGNLGRVGAHAAIGAIEGSASAAILEPLNYYVNRDLGRDYTAMDSVANLAFGGLLGAGLHAGAGYFHDRHMGRLTGEIAKSFGPLMEGDGTVPLAPRMDPPPQPTALHVASLTPDAQHVMLQTAIGQLVDEDLGGVSLLPLLEKIDQATAQRVAKHEASAGDIPLREIRSDEAITSTGRRVGVQYAIVEASEIRASHTNDMIPNPQYPADLQPRNRSKAASLTQILEMERTPNPDLLGEQPQASDGAPIITRQGAVLSGNARMIMLKRLADDHVHGNAAKFEQYKSWLTSKGYDISGFKFPILARVLTDDLATPDVLAFTRESNVSAVTTMSAGEVATNDALAIPDTVLDLHRGGDFRLQTNRDFLTRMIESIVPTQGERAAMMTKEGGLTADGAKRVERALLARAFDDASLIQTLTENTDDSNIKTIGNSLADVAPLWAKMRGEARSGIIEHGVDSTEQLLTAISLVRRARDEGRSITDLVGQSDIFSGDVDPITKAWVAAFFRNDEMTQATGREKLTEFLNAYATEARKQVPGHNLLGDHNATPGQIIASLREAARRRAGGEAELFKPKPGDAENPGVALSAAEHPSGTRGSARPVEQGNGAAGEPVSPPAVDLPDVPRKAWATPSVQEFDRAYHGTIRAFDEFGNNLSEHQHNSAARRGSVAASSDPEVAATYAEGDRIWDKLLNDASQLRSEKSDAVISGDTALEEELTTKLRAKEREFKDYAATKGGSAGSNIRPVYAAFRNPLVVDAKGRIWKSISGGELRNGEWVRYDRNSNEFVPSEPYTHRDINWYVDEAKRQGHDGVIVKNVVDTASETMQKPATTYISLDGKNMKSIFSLSDAQPTHAPDSARPATPTPATARSSAPAALDLSQYRHPITGQTLEEATAEALTRTETIHDNSPQRADLREKIVLDLYKDGATAKNREATLILGPPASGKSFVSGPLLQKTGSMLIDVDEAKKMLPEFDNGLGAGAVHEESSLIRDMLLDAAVANGDNFVMPATGSSPISIEKIVTTLRGAGYRVNAILMTIPVEESVRRAAVRFAESGRLVNIEFLKSVADRPTLTFNKMVAENQFDHFERYDNDVPKGEKPRLVQSGDKPRSSAGAGNVETGNAAQPGAGLSGGAGEGVRRGKVEPGNGSGGDRGGRAISDELKAVHVQTQALEAQLVELNRQGVISDTDVAFQPLEEERMARHNSNALKAAAVCLASKAVLL